MIIETNNDNIFRAEQKQPAPMLTNAVTNGFPDLRG